MSGREQKVLVIQDATKELSSTAMRWVLKGLSLRPHDEIILLGIVQPLASAGCTSPTIGCGTLARYTHRLDSSSTLNQRQDFFDREVEKKRKEYQNNAEIREILKLYEKQQIDFQIRVEAGHSLRDTTIKRAKNLGATCVILDRQMKKDKKYVMESLSCGVLRVKKDNSIERLRDPRLVENKTRISEKGQSSQMKFNNSMGKIQKEAYENPETSSKGETPEDISRSYICSLCLNKRPNSGIFEEFTYSELEAATNSFSTQNVRYIGGNQIFMGNLPSGMRIAVKDHTFYSNAVKEYKSKGIYEKEFKSEVQLLGKARHKNITILLGSCAEDGYRLLVYEYVCNGSLDQYLSDKKELPWETRVTIATGAAKGLEYLHKRNIYGNVRPNNILLTHDHNAQLAHFGLMRNQYEESHLMLKGRVKKTFEYVAPEYEDTGIDSSKSDVFSFGVVLLELITGQRSIQDTGGRSFLIWARPLLKKKMYAELIDPMVIESHDIHQLLLMVRVVEKCLNWDPDKRFSINKVVYALECISQGREIEDFSPTECF